MKSYSVINNCSNSVIISVKEEDPGKVLQTQKTKTIYIGGNTFSSKHHTVQSLKNIFSKDGDFFKVENHLFPFHNIHSDKMNKFLTCRFSSPLVISPPQAKI